MRKLPKNFAVHTLGCKVNFAESSFLSEQLRTEGIEKTEFKNKADLYIIHSCALTAAAEKKTRQLIQKARRTNPDAEIAVIGCVSELLSEKLLNYDGVKYILGNSSKFNLHDLLGLSEKVIKTNEIDNISDFNISYSLNERTRAFLKVQDGCDCFCHYCIVPYARGRSRSATIDEVYSAALKIADKGIREIVLTGINLGDFGKTSGEKLENLIGKISEIDGINRIRLSSIEPQYVTAELLTLFQTNSKCMPHFHLPIQSGCDETLSRMGRKYSSTDIVNICADIVRKLPDACIAADIISGFPGETDDEFEITYDFLKNLPLAYMHVFTFSGREGTKAFHMKEQVDEQVKKHRTNRLLALSQQKHEEFCQRFIGKKLKILVEAKATGNFLTGYSENYIKTQIPFQADVINTEIEVISDSYNSDFDGLNAHCMSFSKKTLVLGASEKQYRYSNMAVRMLQEYNIDVIAIGKSEGKIGTIQIQNNLPEYTDIHTVTVYLNPENQGEYVNFIIKKIKPKRIIFNPGSENVKFRQMAEIEGIDVQENCTLVMLRAGIY